MMMTMSDSGDDGRSITRADYAGAPKGLPNQPKE